MPQVLFRNTPLLIVLALVPALAALWTRACRIVAKATADRTDDDAKRHAAAANRLRGALRLAALAALVTALSGPTLFLPSRRPAAGVPVVFVLDVSASMQADDVEPDRLTHARAAVRRLAELLPDAHTALVVAAHDAVVACPPTADHAAFLNLLDSADVAWMGATGTRLAEALDRAFGMLRRDAGGGGVVVLVSDGEDHGPDPEQAIRRARRRGAVTHTLTVGSPDGALLPDLPLSRDGEGPIVSRAQPERMARWAQAGGGQAWLIAPDRTVLPQERTDLVPRRVALTVSREAGGGLELAPLLCLAAALLLAVDAFAGR